MAAIPEVCGIMDYPRERGFERYGIESAYCSSLFFLMAEDSGVDLINYTIGSDKGRGSCWNAPEYSPCGNWYQVINPTAIKSIVLPKYNESH